MHNCHFPRASTLHVCVRRTGAAADLPSAGTRMRQSRASQSHAQGQQTVPLVAPQLWACYVRTVDSAAAAPGSDHESGRQTSIMISFLLKSGFVKGSLYWARRQVAPGGMRRRAAASRSSSRRWLTSTHGCAAMPPKGSTATRLLAAVRTSTAASRGAGASASESDSRTKAMDEATELEERSVKTGVVMSIFSPRSLPPKMYPASCLNEFPLPDSTDSASWRMGT
mmetsp:Transcript_21194/g.36401  ORF Transcript_21194/g.36401 Transcript_21194/m.36401 type:complete len:225 (+) Transcript_21194:773-1447(+)